jgi:predicted Zn-dependent peptidase
MRTAAWILISVGLLALLAPPSPGQTDAVEPVVLPFVVQEFGLRNGLRVVLVPDDRLPLVTVAVAYRAGTLYEKPSQEGLAYLLENLMFQGSENVGPLQHVAFIQKVGGELNATTTPDKALFYETLPSNQLALALWLESDRMKSLALTPAAILRTRGELVEEHRARLAADPYLATFAQFDQLLFSDPLYGHPLVRDGTQMGTLSETEVLEFHRTFYVPNNALLCIAGNIDPGRTRELVSRYFDSIPPGSDIPLPVRPQFKRENDAVVRTVRVPSVSAGFHMGFRFFPLQRGEADCVRLLAYLLFEGETARLRNRLLKRDLIARYLNGAVDERLSAITLKLFCLATNDVMIARSEKAILSEIDRLKTNAVSAEELGRARRRYKRDVLEGLSTNLGRARFLADVWASGRGFEGLERGINAVLAVTPQALSAFAVRYFIPQNRVILEFGPQ